jgi:hypothetical protein
VTKAGEEQTAPVEGEDFYWEGPYMVFTEAWHRKRGYCCGSGCRHCPWKADREARERERRPEIREESSMTRDTIEARRSR